MNVELNIERVREAMNRFVKRGEYNDMFYDCKSFDHYYNICYLMYCKNHVFYKAMNFNLEDCYERNDDV